MKVIIIKDCKDGKVNDVIDVAGGYATNFLIKNGFALPLNNKTEHMLKNKIKNIKDMDDSERENALKAKKIIENLKISFTLKVTNNVVHGSITKKQINKALIENGIKLDQRHIEHVQIASIGISKVKIDLYKDIFAELKVEVKGESK